MTNFVALNVKTANAFKRSICQIGITEVLDGKVQSPRSWLVKPKEDYNKSYIAFNGITPEDTKNSPSFPDVWKNVYPFLEGKIVVAHYTSFQMFALKDAFDDNKMEYPTFDYFCTCNISKFLIKGLYSYSLDKVLNYLSITFEANHKADNDSKGCAELLLKFLEMDNCTLEEMVNKYQFQRGKFAPNTFVSPLSIRKSKKIVLSDHPELVDEGNYFYGKNVCFTGKCIYGNREEMLQKIKDIGGIPTNSVTKKTEILVVGQQDYRVVGDSCMSGKQKKALMLLDKGQDIEILSEIEFLEIF